MPSTGPSIRWFATMATPDVRCLVASSNCACGETARAGTESGDGQGGQSHPQSHLRKNYNYYLFCLQHSHCALNCTQSFNGGETPWMFYDAPNPPIWHRSVNALMRFNALMQLLTDLPPLQHGNLTFLIWTHVPVYTV